VSADLVRPVPALITGLIRDAGAHIQVHQGSVLVRQHEESTSVLLIERGLVRVSVDTAEGHHLVLALRGSGELIGELASIGDRPRSASVVALTDVSAVVVTATKFLAILRAQPQFSLEVLRTVVHRLDESDRRRLENGTFAVPRRLARLLLELADNHGQPALRGGVEINRILTQAEMGNAIGVTRESVVRALRRLREKRVVTTSRQRIIVLRRDVLAEEAGVHD
jgi:CRP/FNR family cyclic AMP-dependent transcriptional regulator